MDIYGRLGRQADRQRGEGECAKTLRVSVRDSTLAAKGFRGQSSLILCMESWQQRTHNMMKAQFRFEDTCISCALQYTTLQKRSFETNDWHLDWRRHSPRAHCERRAEREGSS